MALTYSLVVGVGRYDNDLRKGIINHKYDITYNHVMMCCFLKICWMTSLLLDDIRMRLREFRGLAPKSFWGGADSPKSPDHGDNPPSPPTTN